MLGPNAKDREMPSAKDPVEVDKGGVGGSTQLEQDAA